MCVYRDYVKWTNNRKWKPPRNLGQVQKSAERGTIYLCSANAMSHFIAVSDIKCFYSLKQWRSLTFLQPSRTTKITIFFFSVLVQGRRESVVAENCCEKCNWGLYCFSGYFINFFFFFFVTRGCLIRSLNYFLLPDINNNITLFNNSIINYIWII